MSVIIFSPATQYFSVFGFEIYFYGVILAVAIFIGFFVSNKIATQLYNKNFVYNQASILIIGSLLGARLYYCLLNYSYYIKNPITFFYFREGGLSIHGAILTGILLIFLLSKHYNYNFLKLCDIYAVSLPLAQSIGRWGNFFNSEAFGIPSYSFFKLYIAPQYRPIDYSVNNYFHPTFLYESILDFILFIILLSLIKKMNKFSGFVSGLYLLGYSTIRIWIEPLRLDCSSYLFGFPIPIIISVLLTIIGIGLIIFALKQTFSSK